MPQREILWNVPPGVVAGLYVLSALSFLWVGLWFFRRSRLWARGAPGAGRADWSRGLARVARYLLTQDRIGTDPYAGWMHRLVFWGFVALLVATTLVGIQHHTGTEFLTGPTYLLFSLGADLGGLAFVVGVGMALWRRRRGGAARLLPSASTTWMLWLLLVLAVTGFLVEAARIARDFPSFERWSPVGYALALALAAVGAGGEAVPPVHLALWLFHGALAIAFFMVIPVTLLRHIGLAACNVARPGGRLGVLPEPVRAVTGPVDLPDFRRLDLVDADACLTCGRCTEVCPAHAAGKPLSPRGVVLGLRDHLDRPDIDLTHLVADDALWSCTTCNACDVACPIGIRVLDKIVTLRRGRVGAGAVPPAAADALESTAQKFNPFGRANSARLEWATGLDVHVAKEGEPVELLYWVGCAGAFDPAGREVTRAVVAILSHLGIAYRVLGSAERCTGDPARRLGEEGLWRELAEHNRRLFQAHQVRTILTQCPHCWHAFGYEYAALGPMPRVVHHSQWLREKLAGGTLKVRPALAETVTFHDPCYLGRVNGETAAPRDVLDEVYNGRRVELPLSGKNSFCCGGGGGQVWLDVRGRTRVEVVRAGQADETGAGTVATACPFCRVMLEAGRSGLEAGRGNWRVRDIAELVAENLVAGPGGR